MRFDIMKRIALIGIQLTLVVGIITFPIGIYFIVSSLVSSPLHAGVMLLFISFLSLIMSFLFHTILEETDTNQYNNEVMLETCGNWEEEEWGG